MANRVVSTGSITARMLWLLRVVEMMCFTEYDGEVRGGGRGFDRLNHHRFFGSTTARMLWSLSVVEMTCFTEYDGEVRGGGRGFDRLNHRKFFGSTNTDFLVQPTQFSRGQTL